MKGTGSLDGNKAVGMRFAEIRRSKGISQMTAAKALGTTQSNISQLENGRRRISSAAAVELCRFYGVPASEVFGALTDEPSESFKAGEAETLLLELAANSGSDDVASSAEAYLSLCVYRLLRELYELNPHNSSGLFSIPKDKAEALCEEFLASEPERLRATLAAGSPSQRSRIELPIERSGGLRRFIAACEELLERRSGKS